MQLTGDRLILSASDLVNYVECPHLSALDLRVATGVAVIETTRSDTADLVAGKGDEHEAAHLRSLRAGGLDVIEIPDARGSLLAAAEATRDAMRTGADVVYQAALVDGDWRGFADFLERVDRPSPAFGSFSYEVLDTKLARHTKPYFLIQLCVYSDLLGRLQGMRPEHMHIVLGSGERVSYRVDEFFAYYERLKARYGEQLLESFAGSHPEPVSRCGLCRWSGHCDRVWLDADHLSLVANIARPRSCASATPASIPSSSWPRQPGEAEPYGRSDVRALRQQARLQATSVTRPAACELLAPQDGRGFALLPRPAAATSSSTSRATRSTRAGSSTSSASRASRMESRCFRAAGRWTAPRRSTRSSSSSTSSWRPCEDPDLHIYHYAAYERPR